MPRPYAPDRLRRKTRRTAPERLIRPGTQTHPGVEAGARHVLGKARWFGRVSAFQSTAGEWCARRALGRVARPGQWFTAGGPQSSR